MRKSRTAIAALMLGLLGVLAVASNWVADEPENGLLFADRDCC